MKAILFDLDETLILDEPISHAAFAAAADLAASTGADVNRLAADAGANARRRWAEGPFYDYTLRIGHSAWEGLAARYDVGAHLAIAGLRQWAPGYRLAVWQEALGAQGVTDAALPALMAAKYFETRRRYPLYPEINALLAHLEGEGYRLGIVTNGVPDLQREKLAGCGVATLFHASVVSGEIDCGKPDPGIFRHICHDLGVEPRDCVMVGDNPERDVAGAIAAGMKSVWVQRNGRPRDARFPADLECDNLDRMVTWLKE
ncbi:MAG TPA: HAD-IA family hydrolase [Symbiobacteriaceae bacterium]|nr:HAD-IA family hydrolase [Symbiobacteriaceae bacterium]